MLTIKPYDPEQPISEPGLYAMTADQYHADPCATPSLSASVAKLALPGGRKGGSPLHMQWGHPRLRPGEQDEQEGVRKFDMGSAFHALVLGQGRDIVVVEAGDWRTKAAQEARAAAYAAGQQPVLKSQFGRAQAMVRSANAQLVHWRELHEAMSAGVAETVLVWSENTPAGPILCRSMLDWIPERGEAFPDWKTTEGSAGPDDFGRTLFDTGADVQDAFYRRGIRAVLDRRAYLLFAAIEVAEPHAMMVHRIAPASAAMADRKVRWAINVFGMCLHRGFWPGYPAEIAFQDAAPWQERAWTDREDAGLTDPSYTGRMIELLADTPKGGGPGFDPEFAADFNLTEREGGSDVV